MSHPHSPGPGGYPYPPTAVPGGPRYPAPQPPPRKPRTGAILGGVAAVLVVVLGVASTLYFTGFFDSDKPGGRKPVDKSSASETAAPLAYRHSGSLCQDVDWSPATEVLGLKPEQATGSGAEVDNEADYTNCHLDYGDTSIDPGKQLEVFVYVFDSPDGAEDRYRENQQNPQADEYREAEGDWARGQLWSGDASSGGDRLWNVGMDVQDGNVSMHVWLAVPDVDGPKSGEQAAEAVMKEMLELLARE